MTVLHLCVIGDGLTCGMGDPLGAGWPGRLSALAEKHGAVVELSRVGAATATSAELARHWRSEAEFRLPGRGGLLFQFGAMDMAHDPRARRPGYLESLTATLYHSRAMMAAAAKWRPTLWIGPAPVMAGTPTFVDGRGRTLELSNDRLMAVNEAFVRLSHDLGIPYLDVMTPLAHDARWSDSIMEVDGIHPGADGHARLAELVAQWDAWQRWLPTGKKTLMAG